MRRCWSALFLALLPLASLLAEAQAARQTISETPSRTAAKEHIEQRNRWFYRGRIVPGTASAALRWHAYQGKVRMRTQRASSAHFAAGSQSAPLSTGSWIPLGPAPLASDASGNDTQDYGQVAGRVTAVAIDPADPTGNTVYIGAAQGGVWKSTNAAYSIANNVAWTPLTDDQATLSIGSVAIQPGNSDVMRSVILAATGEANNSGDSYFGLGILRSTDAGDTWNLISTANSGALTFSGLGGTRMAFSTVHPNTVVAAMATSSEALIVGAVRSSTRPGLYTSINAGQSWTYNALVDPGGSIDATSATSVVYNATANSGAGMFLAAVRYHGFYSSADGAHWTRLTAQPGGSTLSLAACPLQSTSNNRACPIYRGELAVVPGRNEMYAWYVFVDASGVTQDGGVWRSLNGGASWTQISDAGITNCGDVDGCGVQQGTYNLELLAVPNCANGAPSCAGDVTDLYAGAVNVYKCAINQNNPTCLASPFMNLTHAYGCVPSGAPANVHPHQHAMAAIIPTMGSDSGNELVYFANDGGVYRALDGVSGLNSGACSATNQFENLNQNLGSLAQFVSFSQHTTDADTLLGGIQGNGTPATDHATSDTSWINVLGGDGGYTAIDSGPASTWYASNPDLPPGGLGIQRCTQGVNCNNGSFNFVVSSDDLGGDDGGFYFPYILDSGSNAAMIVGTCRVWRGSRSGGTFTALSPNFETLGSGTCTGDEVNQVRALTAAGPTQSSSGSSVIYATTSGLGPIESPLYWPPGGRVWVTTDSSAGPAAFVDVTDNGPEGSINPNQFPISSVAADPSDSSGKTAYITVMGFSGGTGHVWKTMDAGATWTDFTANLPDVPVNAAVVYPALGQVYVGTDVGVFASSILTPNWTELGPSAGQSGLLPNAAVTALGVFDSGGQQLLRASTYGRGMWQFNLVITPDFQMKAPSPSLTVFGGQTASFSGMISALNGYTSSVTLSCVDGSTAPPSVCAPLPTNLTPASKTPFTVNVSDTVGDYNFNVQAVGSDANHLTRKLPLTLHVIDFGITAPSPSSLTIPRGTTSSAVSFQVTAAGSFSQAVTVSCNTTIANAVCNFSPNATVSPTSNSPVNMTATVTVPAVTAPGNYSVTLQATSAGAPSATTGFTVQVTANPHFELDVPESLAMKAGGSGTSGVISLSVVDGFSGTVSLTCAEGTGSASCSITPSSVNSYPASAAIAVAGSSEAGSHTLLVTGRSGSLTQSKPITLNVGDYSVSGIPGVTAVPGSQASANLILTSSYAYSGKINLSCDASTLAAAICTITPTNSVTLRSGGTSRLTVTIDVPNDARPGTYNIGLESQDEDGAPSHSVNFGLVVATDFVVTSATPSQTVQAGQTSGAYNLTVQPVGNSFDAPVTLACTAGLPAGAQCLFSPPTPITPGPTAVNVVMSISTQAHSAILREILPAPIVPALWLFSPWLLITFLPRRTAKFRRDIRRSLGIAFVLALFLSLPSCSGVSAGGGGGGGGGGSVPATYRVTVTGSAPGTPVSAGHSLTVTLVVE